MRDWEEMTPAQLNLYIDADNHRREDMQTAAQAYIYSLAALIRPMVWAKHPPSYDRVFPQKQTAAQTDAQMYALVRALNAKFGGEEAT